MTRDEESRPVPAMAGLTLGASLAGLTVAGIAGRILTLEEFALLAACLAVAGTIAALVAGGGLVAPLLRVLHPPFAAAAGWRGISGFARALLVLVLGLGAGLALAFGPGAGLFGQLSPANELDGAAPTAGGLVALMAFAAALAGTFAALGRRGLETAFAPGHAFGGPIATLLTLALLLSVMWGGGPLDLMVVLGLVLFGHALAAALAAVLLSGEIGRQAAREDDAHGPRAEGLIHLALAIAASILASAEIWILLARGDLVALAQFAAALALVAAILAPLAAAHAAIGPFLGALHAYGEHASLERLARAVTTVAAIPTLLLVIVALVWPSELLSLVFGPRFAPAAPALRALLPGAALAALAGPGLAIIAETGHTRIALVIAVLGGLVTAGFGLALVGPFGLAGLAAATSVGLALASLLANAHLSARQDLIPAAYRRPEMVLASLVAFVEEVGRLFPARRGEDAAQSYYQG